MVVQSYVIYLVLSIALTVCVGRSLNKNGRVFLIEAFKGNIALADSINHLLLVGFYLINIGFVSVTLQLGAKPETVEESFEFLSVKVGSVLLLLGIMHFLNMCLLVNPRHNKIFGFASPSVPNDSKPAAMTGNENPGGNW